MGKKTNTIIALAGLATLSLHVINRIQFSLSTAREYLSSSDNMYYEWRFGKIKYTKKGNGTPILLLHDLTPGSSGYEYKALTDSLSEKHEVYILDLLGYGLSDKPNITYTNYLYVQSVIDFIKNVIKKKTDIIASGDSASIAVMAAHNDGEVTDRIILLNPQSLNKLNLIPTKRSRLLKLIIDLPVIGTFIYNMQTTQEAFYKKFSEELYYNPSNIKPEIMEVYNEAAHTRDYNAKYSFSSYVSRFMNANILHALKEIDHSIYIIYGNEREENKEIADSYISYNQSIEAFPIEGSKAIPHMEKPKAVLNHLELFL